MSALMEPSLSLRSIPIRNRSVVSQRAGQEIVLVLPALGKVKVLNDVGARIWELCDGIHNVGEIAAQLCREFAVESARAEGDTLDFLSDLARRGVLSVGG